MWLVKVGQKLQRKYAGWNHEFRMRTQAFTSSDGDQWAMIHTSSLMIDDHQLSFGYPSAQLEKQPSWVREIFKIRGVSGVFLFPYRVQVNWGRMFQPEEIVPQVERIIIKGLAA